MKSSVRKERQAKAGKYVSVAKGPLFQPATGSTTAHLAEQSQSRSGSGKGSADTGKGRKRRIELPFRMKKAQENQGFPDTSAGQDDIMVLLPLL